MIEIEDESGNDAHFLSLIEAAESQALLKSKRQKTSPSSSTLETRVVGPYTAALRSTHTSLWQDLHHQQHRKQPATKPPAVTNDSSSCFKCGMGGHWARDCGAAVGSTAKVGGSFGGELAEKMCPCGSGACVVRISNTAKNPGRNFYRCPLREENGGCNFFEWCDTPSSGLPTSGSFSSYQPNSSVSDFPCPCGVGPCLLLVSKTGKNVGQQFYKCPATEGGGCGFFKWYNEPTSFSHQAAFSSQSYTSYSSNQSSVERSGSSCFKCGEEGHWARDCPKSSSDSFTKTAGGNHLTPSGSGSCFKCGKGGHWARDCTVQESGGPVTGDRKASRSFRTPFIKK